MISKYIILSLIFILCIIVFIHFIRNCSKSEYFNGNTVNIVVSRYNRNVDWANKIPGNVNILVYDKENPENEFNVPVNKGNEASTYLKYIVDYYDKLPDYTFFIHDEEYSWHHSGSIIDKYNEAINSNKLYFNINDLSVLGDITTNEWYDEILEWYNKYIEPYIPINKLPDKNWTTGYRGCAQFLVHKKLLTNLPQKFYKDLYDWIITTDMKSSKSGRFMEWTWHIFWDILPNLKLNN